MLNIRRESVPAAAAIPLPEVAGQTVADVPSLMTGDVPDVEPVAVLAGTVTTVPVTVPRTVASGRAPAGASRHTSKASEHVFAAELAGTVPSMRAIKTRLRVGTDRARVIRGELTAILQEAQPEVA